MQGLLEDAFRIGKRFLLDAELPQEEKESNQQKDRYQGGESERPEKARRLTVQNRAALR